MSADWLEDTRVSYDTVAVSYAVEVRAALDTQPYLRASLALLPAWSAPSAAVRWRTWAADPST